jgi:hypothetical protein
MCTVTFLPLRDDGFILTSNRDESVFREKADPPEKFSIMDTEVVFPKDRQAGGTWIATGVNGYTLCLLNGAFKRHERKEHYRISRGLMLLDFFKYNDVARFVKEYTFNDIEPFTLVIVDTVGEVNISELRWDGESSVLSEVNEVIPHIWSSVTLYEPEVIAQRKVWFNEWLKNNQRFGSDSIIDFHKFGGEGDPESNLVMSRGNSLFTLSISSVMKAPEGINMKYLDLMSDKEFDIKVI